MAEFIVHTVPGSPYARAVMAMLEEKGAPWRLAALGQGESRQAAHLARHPFGKMPVLEHRGLTLYETQAILRYLDRILPEPPLTPPDPERAARMDQLIGINDQYLFPNCANVIVFHRVVGPALLGTTPDLAAIAEAMPRAHLVFEQLSRQLGEQPFLTGEQLSLADLMIGPQLEFFARTLEWQALTTQRANLVAWLARMEVRPSMRKTVWEALAQLPQAA